MNVFNIVSAFLNILALISIVAASILALKLRKYFKKLALIVFLAIDFLMALYALIKIIEIIVA